MRWKINQLLIVPCPQHTTPSLFRSFKAWLATRFPGNGLLGSGHSGGFTGVKEDTFVSDDMDHCEFLLSIALTDRWLDLSWEVIIFYSPVGHGSFRLSWQIWRSRLSEAPFLLSWLGTSIWSRIMWTKVWLVWTSRACNFSMIVLLRWPFGKLPALWLGSPGLISSVDPECHASGPSVRLVGGEFFVMQPESRYAD